MRLYGLFHTTPTNEKRAHDLYGNHTNHIRSVMQKSKGLLVAVSAF